MTVIISGTQGVTSPKLTLVGTGTSVLNPATTAGTYNYTLPSQSGVLLLSTLALSFPTTYGTAGQVLSTDGAGGTSWVPSGGAATLTIGSSPIASGTTGSILINTSGVLQQLVMGSGVSSALVAGTNAANGFLVANGSGVLPLAQGGTGLSTLGTAGQVLTVNPGATAAIWATPAAGGGLTIGTTGITGGTTGSLLVNTGGVLQGIGLGTAGQVLTVNPGATAAIWATPASGGGLTVGTTSIGSGTTGSLLINTSGVLQEIVMGSGVSGALAAGTNAANGFAVLNGSGVTPIAQGGTGLGSLGTAGQVLTVNPGATAAIWATPASGGGLTVGTTAIGSGTTGSILIDTSGVLQEIVMGSNVASALAAAAGGANGFATLNGSGVLPLAQGGVGGAVNTGWTAILGAAPGTGVAGALAANTNSANGLPVLGAGGAVATAQGGTGLTAIGTAGQVLTVNPGATALIWSTPATYGDGNYVAGNYSGAAPGAGVGVNGDYAFDTSTGKVYGPKAAGAWPATPVYTPPAAPTPATTPSGTSTTVVCDSGVTAGTQTFYYSYTSAYAGGNGLNLDVSVDGGSTWSTLQSGINAGNAAGSSRYGFVMLDQGNNQVRSTFTYVDTGGQGNSASSTGPGAGWGSGTFRMRLRSTANVQYGTFNITIPA